MGIRPPQRRQRSVLRHTEPSRRLLAFAIAVGLVVAMQAPLEAAEQPSKGGTIVWAVHEGMPDFDIHYQGTYIAAQPIGPLYNGLLTFDVYHNETIVGGLAERWEVAPDGKQITFTLRKGVQELDKAIRIGKQHIFDPVLGKIPLIHFYKLRRQGNVSIFFGLFPAVFDPDFRTLGSDTHSG